MYIKSFIINCIFSESLSTHNATIKRSSAESDIKWTLCGKKEKSCFLGQDAIKTANTREESEAEKDGVEVDMRVVFLIHVLLLLLFCNTTLFMS